MSYNIKIKNIYYMLSYAYQNLRRDGFDHLDKEEFEHIHDLFAAILARGVADQVKRGLHRNYTSWEEPLSGLRGQIRIASSIQQQTFPLGKLVCAYDLFSEDVPHNQILKSTMRMLLQHGELKKENKEALVKNLRYFGNVGYIDLRFIRWNTLQYHRNNSFYQTLIEVCDLIVKGLLLTTESGPYRLTKWLREDVLSKLYEKFVLEYYKCHRPDLDPKSEQIKWDLDLKGGSTDSLPSMWTDITLSKDSKKLIIDTKYYKKSMQRHQYGEKATFRSGHLYQIYAYVRNSDKKNTGNVSGMLLYAKTDEEVVPDGDFTIGVNRISLKTLDLNQEWRKIKEQLDSLVSYLD